MAERREFLRVPVNAEVRFRKLPDGEEKRGYVRNISGSGILFSSENVFEPGTLLSLDVVTPPPKLDAGNQEPLRATVRVVRVTGDESPFELAAEFVQLDLP
jgi:c-di-GMP-binding flagellar brake protein YcgR